MLGNSSDPAVEWPLVGFSQQNREYKGLLVLDMLRRQFLRKTSLSSGALLLDYGGLLSSPSSLTSRDDKTAGGTLEGTVGFLNEGSVEMNALFGEELDGRLYTDLDSISEGENLTPESRFYVRTRASKLLPDPKNWTVSVRGLVNLRRSMGIGELRAKSRSMGAHLMECAGNTRAAHFGMISAGTWGGVPMKEVLGGAKLTNSGVRVLVQGFDRYAGTSVTSTPGASWIFDPEDLESSGAFLATELNGAPLSADHGAPVRLVVPGWHGCACIKWVDGISIVRDSAEATSQMLEYAARTHQTGMPRLAKEFVPARIQHAAMPVRVERWRAEGKISYRVVGLLWGGKEAVKTLGIRCNPEEDYKPVEKLPTPQPEPWTVWSHWWTPSERGVYTIRLAILDPALKPKRLESGYYARSVEITEI